jgi:YfiH family protein
MTDLAPPQSFEWRAEPWGRSLRCSPLGQIAPHLFTTRDLVLESIGEPRGAGWTALAGSLGLAADSVLRLRQVHGADAVVVRSEDGRPGLPDPPPEADILATNRPDVALSVRVADCNPVLLADRRSGVVAAAHAGWRGTAARAVQAAVRTLGTAFGSSPSDLVAAIGPSIGPCCYRVGTDVVDAFTAAGMTFAESGRWFHDTPHRAEGGIVGRGTEPEGSGWELAASDFRLPAPEQLAGFRRDGGPARSDVWADLWTATVDQLIAAGLIPGNIHLAGLCTACHLEVFHSYRAERTPFRTAGAIRMGRAAG